MFRNNQRVKLREEKNKQKERSSEWERGGSLCLITLNRPDLEFKLAMVAYFCPSGDEAHSLWDVISTARV